MGKQVTAPARWGGRLSRWKRRRHTLTMGRHGRDRRSPDAREKARRWRKRVSTIAAAMERAGFSSSSGAPTVTPESSVKRWRAALTVRPESRDFRGLFSRASLAARSRPARLWPATGSPGGQEGIEGVGLCPPRSQGGAAGGVGRGRPEAPEDHQPPRRGPHPDQGRRGRREDDGLCAVASAYLLFNKREQNELPVPWDVEPDHRADRGEVGRPDRFCASRA